MKHVGWALLLALWAWGCDDGSDEAAKDDGGARDGGVAGDARVPEGDGALPIPDELPKALFELADDPPTTPLAQIPFPSDLYRTQTGKLDLRGFPHPVQVGIQRTVTTAIENQLDGFGTSATMYLAFGSTIDPRALPDGPAASLADDASLFVVDVDPDSPERGRKWPINWRVQATETSFLPANSLAVRLVEGVALRPRTIYALVLTTAAAEPSPLFRQTIEDARPDGPLGRAHDVHAPLRAWLADHKVEVATASVFTTQDPVSELFQARDFIHTLPKPQAEDVVTAGIKQSLFELIEGWYRAPRFQKGDPPYAVARIPDEGAIEFDADGNPIVQGEERLRFALSVPLGPPPAEGWPVVLYGHGTGGNYTSFFRADVAAVLSRVGIAVISMDQIHHGPRDPRPDGCDAKTGAARDTCVQLAFFNFLVPAAGRDNVRQSALDLVSLMRLAQTLDFDEGLSVQGQRIKLNPNQIMYMGHSQGGLNGPLFMAIEPQVKAGMLSAAGACIPISIEQKTEPVDINQLVRAAVRVGDNDSLDRWHPVLSLLQTYIEVSDGANYAGFWFDEPPEGYAPKSVFMTAGLEDEYTPPDAIFALAAAGRVPVVQTVLVPIEALTLLGIESDDIPPFAGNVAGGAAAAGLAQYAGEGHFIIQNVPSAKQRYRKFFESVVKGEPTIY
ncbi:MAG: hypothetical protein H6704_21690 [Myxococcales bacterium]|nr:hypothetical protein [Myxococcales bacterium]MCB9538855.1 hypothetical protein [Myxococcales bacterium]